MPPLRVSVALTSAVATESVPPAMTEMASFVMRLWMVTGVRIETVGSAALSMVTSSAEAGRTLALSPDLFQLLASFQLTPSPPPSHVRTVSSQRFSSSSSVSVPARRYSMVSPAAGCGASGAAIAPGTERRGPAPQK